MIVGQKYWQQASALEAYTNAGAFVRPTASERIDQGRILGKETSHERTQSIHTH